MRAQITKDISVDCENGTRAFLRKGEGGRVIQQCGEILTFVPDRPFPWTGGQMTIAHCLVDAKHIQLLVTTQTGREIPAPPAIPMRSERVVAQGLRRMYTWLREQAIKEAQARGDEYNQMRFQNERADNLPPATINDMNEYLFGDANPYWEIGKRHAPRPRLFIPGQIFTRSGRKIAPPPDIRLLNARHTRSDLDALDAWLFQQAGEEAQARDETLAVEPADPKNPTPAERNYLLRYLFGDANPEWSLDR